MRLFILLGICLVLFGCTLPEAGQNESFAGSVNETVSIGSFEEYENIGVTFDYPEGAKVSEQLSSYPSYAVAAIGDDATNSSILFMFMNMTYFSKGLSGTSEELAKEFLDSQSRQDTMGILHQAATKGGITTYQSPAGIYFAEMEFSLKAEGPDGKEASKQGYALEVFDTDREARYGIRIFADDRGTAKLLKERFVSSFRYSETQDTSEEEDTAMPSPDENATINETSGPDLRNCIDSELVINETRSGCVQVGDVKYTDKCFDSKTALEYYCDGGEVANVTVTCPEGQECFKGACRIKGCYSEYVAYNVYRKETVNITGYDISDQCANSTHVTDYYCDNGYVVSLTSGCLEGYSCQDGRCVSEDEEGEAPPEGCFDSDYGAASRTKGTTSLDDESQEDECIDEKNLGEYFCENDTIKQVIVDCGTGFRCEDGACVLGAPAQIVR